MVTVLLISEMTCSISLTLNPLVVLQHFINPVQKESHVGACSINCVIQDEEALVTMATVRSQPCLDRVILFHILCLNIHALTDIAFLTTFTFIPRSSIDTVTYVSITTL